MSRATRPQQLRDAQNNVIGHSVDQDALRANKNGTGNLVYVGYARSGAQEGEAVWRIAKNTYDASGNVVKVEFSGGDHDYDSVWDASSDVAISAITQANPGQVTTSTAHGYSNNDIIEISSVTGMTEINSDGYGSKVYTVTVVDTTNFTVGVDTSGYTAYSSGGICNDRDVLNNTYS